jgi:hypothetical protein
LPDAGRKLPVRVGFMYNTTADKQIALCMGSRPDVFFFHERISNAGRRALRFYARFSVLYISVQNETLL